MSFRNNAYATVWEVKPTNGPSWRARISTSYKDKNTGEYISDFGEYVFLSGQAAQKANTLKEKDRIRLLDTSATSKYDKEKKVCSYSFTVWDFESIGRDGGTGNRQTSSAQPKAQPAAAPASDDELPF